MTKARKPVASIAAWPPCARCSLLAFGHRTGYLHFNVGAAIRPLPQVNRGVERILLERDTLNLIHVAGAPTPQGRRNQVLLQFLYYTGARVSEACALQWRDLHDLEGHRPVVAIHGKGGPDHSCLPPLAAPCPCQPRPGPGRGRTCSAAHLGPCLPGYHYPLCARAARQKQWAQTADSQSLENLAREQLHPVLRNVYGPILQCGSIGADIIFTDPKGYDGLCAGVANGIPG